MTTTMTVSQSQSAAPQRHDDDDDDAVVVGRPPVSKVALSNRLWLSNVTTRYSTRSTSDPSLSSSSSSSSSSTTLKLALIEYFQQLPLVQVSSSLLSRSGQEEASRSLVDSHQDQDQDQDHDHEDPQPTLPANNDNNDNNNNSTTTTTHSSSSSSSSSLSSNYHHCKVLDIFLPERSKKRYAFVTVETQEQAQAILNYFHGSDSNIGSNGYGGGSGAASRTSVNSNTNNGDGDGNDDNDNNNSGPLLLFGTIDPAGSSQPRRDTITITIPLDKYQATTKKKKPKCPKENENAIPILLLRESTPPPQQQQQQQQQQYGSTRRHKPATITTTTSSTTTTTTTYDYLAQHSNVILQVDQSHGLRLVHFLLQHQEQQQKKEQQQKEQQDDATSYQMVGFVASPIPGKTLSFLFLKVGTTTTTATATTTTTTSTTTTTTATKQAVSAFMEWMHSIWYIQPHVQRWCDIHHVLRGTVTDTVLPWILQEIQTTMLPILNNGTSSTTTTTTETQIEQQGDDDAVEEEEVVMRLRLSIFPSHLQPQLLPLLEQALLHQRQRQQEQEEKKIGPQILLTPTRATHSLSVFQLRAEPQQQPQQQPRRRLPDIGEDRMNNTSRVITNTNDDDGRCHSTEDDDHDNDDDDNDDNDIDALLGLYVVGRIQPLLDPKNNPREKQLSHWSNRQEDSSSSNNNDINNINIKNNSDDNDDTNDKEEDATPSISLPQSTSSLSPPSGSPTPATTTTTTTTTTNEICRAYSKLKEAWERYPYELPSHPRRMLDCGAAPGGWTQFLAQTYAKYNNNQNNHQDEDEDHSFDCIIYSVDPGALHPTILALPNVQHVAQTIQTALVDLAILAAHQKTNNNISNSSTSSHEYRLLDIWVSDMCVKDMEQQVDWLLAARDQNVVGSGTFCVLTLKCVMGHSSASYEAQCQVQRQRLEPYFRRYYKTRTTTTKNNHHHHHQYDGGADNHHPKAMTRSDMETMAMTKAIDNDTAATDSSPSPEESSSVSSLYMVHLFGNRQSERTLMGYLL